jgi:hypothetical protein
VSATEAIILTAGCWGFFSEPSVPRTCEHFSVRRFAFANANLPRPCVLCLLPTPGRVARLEPWQRQIIANARAQKRMKLAEADDRALNHADAMSADASSPSSVSVSASASGFKQTAPALQRAPSALALYGLEDETQNEDLAAMLRERKQRLQFKYKMNADGSATDAADDWDATGAGGNEAAATRGRDDDDDDNDDDDNDEELDDDGNLKVSRKVSKSAANANAAPALRRSLSSTSSTSSGSGSGSGKSSKTLTGHASSPAAAASVSVFPPPALKRSNSSSSSFGAPTLPALASSVSLPGPPVAVLTVKRRVASSEGSSCGWLVRG